MVTFSELVDKAIHELSSDELKYITAYCVQKKVEKNISPRIINVINEWELPWNDYDFQKKGYYEYGTIAHLYKNQNLIEGQTHIGLLHYDMLFEKNSVNEIIGELERDSSTIFFQMKRPANQLSLLDYELGKLCEFMGNRLGLEVDPVYIKTNGWYSECLSITPKDVFLRFGEFLTYHRHEIETILKNNIWGIMNHCPHRICGIIERMWGFYLASLPNPKKQMNIKHDWYSYNHHHMLTNGSGAKNL
jgi:hypothetical protein